MSASNLFVRGNPTGNMGLFGNPSAASGLWGPGCDTRQTGSQDLFGHPRASQQNVYPGGFGNHHDASQQNSSSSLFRNPNAVATGGSSPNQTTPATPGEMINDKTTTESALLKGIKGFYDSGEHSDLILRCGEEEFKCHKVVLCAQSEYFRTSCKPTITKLNVSFAKRDRVKIMLEFLYTGTYDFTKQLNNDDSAPAMAINIYAMGEQFGVPALRQRASEDFKKMIDDSKDAHDGSEILLRYVSALYYGNPGITRSLRDTLVEAIIHHHRSLVNSEAYEEALFKAANENGAFGKDLFFGLLRSGKENAKPAKKPVGQDPGLGASAGSERPAQIPSVPSLGHNFGGGGGLYR